MEQLLTQYNKTIHDLNTAFNNYIEKYKNEIDKKYKTPDTLQKIYLYLKYISLNIIIIIL